MLKGHAASTPDVSVVIASYNQKDTIKACVESLLNQKTVRSYEVIVVDSSDNGTGDVLERYVPGITLIRSRRRLFGGTAINVGNARARGNIIACTDTDVVVDDTWIENIYREHSKHNVVGGTVHNGTPHSAVGWGVYLFEFSEYIGTRNKHVRHMPTCNISFKKEHLKHYGPFPDVHMSYDLLFTARIGSPIFFSKRVVVTHINRTDAVAVLKHCYMLGYTAAKARRMVRLPGGFLLKRRILIPLLSLYRLALIAYRASCSSHFLPFLLTLPLVISNLIAWNLGFLKNAME